MTKLESDWLTQGLFDAEYKKYVVMAYLQTVHRNFSAGKLCPDLPDLRHHYEAGLRFQRGKGTLNAAFPKRINRIDPKARTIEYKSEVTDDTYLTELDDVMDFALPRFEAACTEGQQRWQDIAATLTLIPIGLMPLRTDEGYLFLHQTRRSETNIYHFTVTLYNEKLPGGRQIRFQYKERVRKGLGITFETLKLDLIRRNRQLPNPATFMLENGADYPEEETVLPIAHELLAKAASA